METAPHRRRAGRQPDGYRTSDEALTAIVTELGVDLEALNSVPPKSNPKVEAMPDPTPATDKPKRRSRTRAAA